MYLRNNWKKKKPNMLGIGLNNPFPDMIQDSKIFREGFKRFNLYPYMGDSQTSYHTYVELLDKLHLYSPTQFSITNSIVKRAFSSAMFAKDSSSGFLTTLEDEEIKISSRANELYELLGKFGYDTERINEIAATIYRKADPTGNAYVLVEYAEGNGEKAVNIRVYGQNQVTKLIPKDTESQFLVTNILFDEQYWQDDDTWNIYEEYENIEKLESENGVKRAIFHFKHEGYENNHYALPRTFGSVYPLFNEWQQWDGLLKETDNNFIGRLLLFYEETYSKSGLPPEQAKKAAQEAMQGVQWRINESVTMGGSGASAVTALTYMQGTKAPSSIVLPSDTNEGWHIAISDKNSKAIYASNGWSPVMLGAEQAKTSLGNNGSNTLEVMEFFDRSTTLPIQNHMCKFLNRIFQSIGDFDETDVKGIELCFLNQTQIKRKEEKEDAENVTT